MVASRVGSPAVVDEDVADAMMFTGVDLTGWTFKKKSSVLFGNDWLQIQRSLVIDYLSSPSKNQRKFDKNYKTIVYLVCEATVTYF
jgi:hypothetical protein